MELAPAIPLPLLNSAQAAKGGSKVAETAMCSRAKRVRCALFLESRGSVESVGEEVAVKVFLLVLAALPLAAQVPRMPDGKPDLQGVWTSATLTPLERPADLGNKQFFTKEEAAQWTKQFLQANNRDRRDGSAQVDVGRAYNEFWFSRGDAVVPTLRTSLIIDPPDGKIPALTADGKKRAD